MTGLPVTGLSIQYAIETADTATGAYTNRCLPLALIPSALPGRVVSATSARPPDVSLPASGSGTVEL